MEGESGRFHLRPNFTPYRAIKAGRFGLGWELSPRYFADGAMYCEAMAREMSMSTLFDLEELEPANG